MAVVLLQQTAREIGLDVQIDAQPPEQYAALFFDPAARSGIDAWFTLNYITAVDPLGSLVEIAAPGGKSNFNGYDNPDVTAELDRAAQEDDPAARAAIVAEIMVTVGQDLPWIPLVIPRVRLFQASGLTGAPKTFTYLNIPWLAMMGAA